MLIAISVLIEAESIEDAEAQIKAALPQTRTVMQGVYNYEDKHWIGEFNCYYCDSIGNLIDSDIEPVSPEKMFCKLGHTEAKAGCWACDRKVEWNKSWTGLACTNYKVPDSWKFTAQELRGMPFITETDYAIPGLEKDVPVSEWTAWADKHKDLSF